ncbi:hypothetical protein [Sporisorium scitamineum]|uniref:Uncharacterized protein n=1 Tax=Sporisorium scitamineum TaxID=49012 RepID=A0A0F7S061_9BASI|nr:hypothetical protein [Sporisorium scitamineum]
MIRAAEAIRKGNGRCGDPWWGKERKEEFCGGTG